MQPVGGGQYGAEVDTELLDDNYELIYYVEVIDVMGKGSFYPDPFSDARYRICRPRREQHLS